MLVPGALLSAISTSFRFFSDQSFLWDEVFFAERCLCVCPECRRSRTGRRCLPPSRPARSAGPRATAGPRVGGSSHTYSYAYIYQTRTTVHRTERTKPPSSRRDDMMRRGSEGRHAQCRCLLRCWMDISPTRDSLRVWTQADDFVPSSLVIFSHANSESCFIVTNGSFARRNTDDSSGRRHLRRRFQERRSSRESPAGARRQTSWVRGNSAGGGGARLPGLADCSLRSRP